MKGSGFRFSVSELRFEPVALNSASERRLLDPCRRKRESVGGPLSELLSLPWKQLNERSPLN